MDLLMVQYLSLCVVIHERCFGGFFLFFPCSVDQSGLLDSWPIGAPNHPPLPPPSSPPPPTLRLTGSPPLIGSPVSPLRISPRLSPPAAPVRSYSTPRLPIGRPTTWLRFMRPRSCLTTRMLQRNWRGVRRPRPGRPHRRVRRAPGGTPRLVGRGPGGA